MGSSRDEPNSLIEKLPRENEKRDTVDNAPSLQPMVPTPPQQESRAQLSSPPCSSDSGKDSEKQFSQTSIENRDPHKTESGNEADADSELVTYEGPDDPTNPHNWPQYRKWIVTILQSLGGTVTLMSGAMMAPALSVIGKDLNIGDEQTQMALSIFVLAFAFGPIFLAPLSEVFGRKKVWMSSGCWYILWNTVCGFANSNAVMIVARVMAGFGASAEFAIGSPVLADCWRAHERGKSFAIATFIPLLGPAIGPIIGGLITQGAGWRWLFWTLSIFDALLMFTALFLYPETSAHTILKRKARALKRANPTRNYYTEYGPLDQSLITKLTTSLTRPIRLLATQPIIQLISFYLAYNFGLLYIVLSTFATLWTNHYNQSISTSGLHYIAIVIGYTIAAQGAAPITDRLWAYLKSRHDGETQPEYRIPLMIPGAVLIPTGLFLYGFTAEARVHWIVPDIGILIFGCGIIVGTQAMQAYVMDSFPKYVASASAASQLLRSIAGFAFPVFAPRLYLVLGYGWGNGLLAFLFLAIGVPAPLFLWKFGAKLRGMGKPQW